MKLAHPRDLIPDLASEARADFVREHRAAVERLTMADVHALERQVDDGIEALQTTHRRKVCAHELERILTAIDFDPESHQGHVAVRYHAVEAAFNLAQALLQKYPREAGYILDQCVLDKSGEWLIWLGMVTE